MILNRVKLEYEVIFVKYFASVIPSISKPKTLV